MKRSTEKIHGHCLRSDTPEKIDYYLDLTKRVPPGQRYLACDMNQIRAYFEKNIGLSEQDWKFFSSKLKREEFPKKHLLLKSGEIENRLSFIEKGTLRFFIPGEENDLTFAFAFQHNFVSAYDSFLTRQPSTYQIETLTNTILWSVNFDDLQHIYSETAAGNTIGRLAGEDLFMKKSRRELSLLKDTAEQRSQNLFTEQPQLLRTIPLKYIASYIGVTPQALSRIRKRIN